MRTRETARRSLRRARESLIASLNRSGLSRAAGRSAWRRRRLLVLCYHGVSLLDEHRWADSLFVSPDHLRTRLEHLRTVGATVLPLGEALQRLRDGSLPPLSVSLTFDDGLYDYYAKAMPLLGEFGCPATVYLTTYYMHRREPVFPVVTEYVMFKSAHDSFDLRELIDGEPFPVNLRSFGRCAAARRRIAAYADERQLTTEQKHELVGRLATLLGVDLEAITASRVLQIMTPEEAAEAHRAGTAIELHTHRHQTPVDRERFLKEISDNRAEIRRLTGKHATHFCYPSGRTDPRFLPWLREAGVESATTCEPGIVSPESDPLMLPRLVDTASVTRDQFEAWVYGINGVFPALARLARLRKAL